jgi:hypothetical protein
VRYTTPEGRTETVLVRGSEEAEKVARWQSAVGNFVQHGDDRQLRRLKYRTFVDAKGTRHRLLTDLELIRDMAHRGEIDIEGVESP